MSVRLSPYINDETVCRVIVKFSVEAVSKSFLKKRFSDGHGQYPYIGTRNFQTSWPFR